jgi:hypothetical protein
MASRLSVILAVQSQTALGLKSLDLQTWLIAKTYEEVAGIPPTLEEEQGLLDELLPELGINANAEHCVRMRRREMKKR